MRRKRGGLPPTLGLESYSTLAKGARYRQPAESAQREKSQTPSEVADEIGEPTECAVELSTDGEPANWAATTKHLGPHQDPGHYKELEDMLNGIAFDRISKYGKRIELKQPKREYL